MPSLAIRFALLGLLCSGAPAALAQEKPPEAPRPRPAAPSASDVAGAPRPDQARNAVKDERSAARKLLWIPRAILFLPRWGLWLAVSPIRAGLYAFDRYGVGDRLRRLLSGNGPIALYPSVARESGHGLTYGVGAGVGHYLRGNFLFGGEVRQLYELRLHSHRLLGEGLELEVIGALQLLGESYFFGIGNDDLQVAGTTSGVDARTDSTAVTTRFDQEIRRLEIAAEWRPRAHVTARPTAAIIDKHYSSVDAGGRLVDIATVYDPATLVGFEDGTRYLYGELRLDYDDRVTTNPFVSLALPATGWKVDGFVGYAAGLAKDPSRYLRYGLDVQRYFDLYLGDRILLLRASLEGVTAGLDDIPFTELPRLGGSRLMRGYRRNRFRDRTTTAFSVEYRYPINRQFGAFVFLDAGGAWRRLRDFDPTALHPGYGAGVQLHTAELFLTRFLVAAGDDGVTFYLSFTPSADVRLTTHAW